MKLTKVMIFTALLVTVVFSNVAAQTLEIKDQGFGTAGGTVRTNSGSIDTSDVYTNRKGQTVHGDNASYFYQIPEKSKKLSLVFLHGNTQSGKCWSTTADGREGFQNIFLRAGYSVYLVDQPRRGQAGNSTQNASVASPADDQRNFNQFRFGLWPNFYKGVQFPADKEILDNFFFQMTPNIGSFDFDVINTAMSALFDKTGPAVFFTHSASGIIGWQTAMKNKNVRAIVAIEPGAFVVPESKAFKNPANSFTETTGMDTSPIPVSDEEFKKLCSIPIIIYFGDNIPSERSREPGEDFWRVKLTEAKRFADIVNSMGGNCAVVHLPEIGIKGNTHFIMSDLNNKEVASHIEKWLKAQGLDK